MSKVSWKEIEQAFEDEKPIDDGIVNFTENENWSEYNEWMTRKMEEEEEERLRDERYWDDDFMYDWDYDAWYGDDSNLEW